MDENKTIDHPIFGELLLDEKLGKWYGKPDALGFHISVDSTPSVDSNVENITRFRDWYSKNQNSLDKRLVFELFNHDIVHGENFIENAGDLDEEAYEKQHEMLESKVQSSLLINDINSFNNKLFVWISAGKYTGGHWIKVALDSEYIILKMDHN